MNMKQMDGGLIEMPVDTPDEVIQRIVSELQQHVRHVVTNDIDDETLRIRYYGNRLSDDRIIEIIGHHCHTANIWKIL